MFRSNGINELSNKALENRIAELLSAGGVTALRRLEITADSGTVTLRGGVENRAARRAILAAVRQVPEVRIIVDRLDVASASGDPRRAVRYQFAPGLESYFEQRRLELIGDSAVA